MLHYILITQTTTSAIEIAIIQYKYYSFVSHFPLKYSFSFTFRKGILLFLLGCSVIPTHGATTVSNTMVTVLLLLK